MDSRDDHTIRIEETQPTTFQIKGDDDRTLLTIHRDGTVEVGSLDDATEAARVFVREIGRTAGWVSPQRLADVVSERDKAREECGYEKRLRASTRESESLFIRLKKEREAERDALAATIQRVEALCDEWQHGENSATKVEPGIAYCARELRHVLGRQYEPGQPGYDPALDGPGEEDG